MTATTPARTMTPPTLTFEHLYQTYHARILSYTFHLLGNREDAEDITQDTFLKIARALPTLKQEQVSSWVYRIATNTAYDHLRRRQMQRAHRSPEDFETATLTLASDEDVLEQTVSCERVQQAWQQLPQQYQAALRSLIAGYAPQELAQERCVSIYSIKSTLYRARSAFRQAYQEVSA